MFSYSSHIYNTHIPQVLLEKQQSWGRGKLLLYHNRVFSFFPRWLNNYKKQQPKFGCTITRFIYLFSFFWFFFRPECALSLDFSRVRGPSLKLSYLSQTTPLSNVSAITQGITGCRIYLFVHSQIFSGSLLARSLSNNTTITSSVKMFFSLFPLLQNLLTLERTIVYFTKSHNCEYTEKFFIEWGEEPLDLISSALFFLSSWWNFPHSILKGRELNTSLTQLPLASQSECWVIPN